LIKVLGEAANRVSKETQAKHPRIPWAQIITRNRLIHGYDFVDLDILWRTVTDNLPALVGQLQGIIPPERA